MGQTSDKPRIKFYCVRRSGSNWMQSLLTQNFDVDVLVHRPVWKHAPFLPVDGVAGYVIPVKHPHAYLVSGTRYYLNHECKAEVPPGILADQWVNTNLSYVHAVAEGANAPILLVRYEDVLQDADHLLGAARDIFGIVPRDDQWSYKPRRETPSGMAYDAYSTDDADAANCAYYLDQRYYLDLPTQSFHAFNKQLDYMRAGARIAKTLGYDVPRGNNLNRVIDGLRTDNDNAL